jgi:hypothetical protein
VNTRDYLPAILTLLAGLITVIVNYLISKKLRENNTYNIQTQLKEARELKIIDIKASINIKNRQEWMNQYRDCLCEYISILMPAFMEVPSDDTLKNVFLLGKKIELLLHPDREFEDKALELHKTLLALVFLKLGKKENKNLDFNEGFTNALSELIIVSRKILDKNWQKMNNIEDK